MANKVVREGAGPRFVAEVRGLPGVIAIGETAWQARMRAAVLVMRAIVFDGASDRAATWQWRGEIKLVRRLPRLP